MIVVLHVYKTYNANSACYESLTRSYKYNLACFLFSNLLSCHQLSKYSSLDTLFNKTTLKWKEKSQQSKEKTLLKS
jgi:hypothetical protein